MIFFYAKKLPEKNYLFSNLTQNRLCSDFFSLNSLNSSNKARQHIRNNNNNHEIFFGIRSSYGFNFSLTNQALIWKAKASIIFLTWFTGVFCSSLTQCSRRHGKNNVLSTDIELILFHIEKCPLLIQKISLIWLVIKLYLVYCLHRV